MEISPIWNVVFIGAFSQGFFVAIILLLQFFKTKHQSQLFLSLFVASFSYILLNNTIFWNSLFQTYPHFLFVAVSIRYLPAPFFLFYCYTFINKKISKWHLLHFLPFLTLLILYIPLLLLSASTKIGVLTNPTTYGELPLSAKIGNFSFTFISVYLIAYSLIIFSELRTYLNQNFGKIDKQKLNQINWLRFLNTLFLLYGLLMLLYFILVALNIGGVEKDYFISVVICVAVYSISFIGVFNPKLLEGEKFIENLTNLKYSRVRLKKEQMEEIVKKLENLMQTDRLFLDPDINLPLVADKLNVPKHHISQALSLQKGRTFNEIINFYRVKHAQSLLENFSAEDSIKTVMFSSGFNNRASFNNNFKKLVGMTASAYLKTVKPVKNN